MNQPLVKKYETFSAASRRVLHVNDTYGSKDILSNFFKRFGDAWSFRAIISSKIYLKCSRDGKKRKRKDILYHNERRLKSNKFECEWFIRFKHVNKVQPIIKITEVYLEHTKGL